MFWCMLCRGSSVLWVIADLVTKFKFMPLCALLRNLYQTYNKLDGLLISYVPPVYKGCDDNSWVKHFMYRPRMIVLDVLHHYHHIQLVPMYNLILKILLFLIPPQEMSYPQLFKSCQGSVLPVLGVGFEISCQSLMNRKKMILRNHPNLMISLIFLQNYSNS